MKKEDLNLDSFSNQTEEVEVLTQQAEGVTALQAHTHVPALRLPAQEQDELAEETVGFHHCQALEHSMEGPLSLGSSTVPLLTCQQHWALAFLPKYSSKLRLL